MTNDDIKRRAVECLDCNTDQHQNINRYVPNDLLWRIESAIREAVTQAYGEAAQIAERHANDRRADVASLYDDKAMLNDMCWMAKAADEIGEGIRTLKDSLTFNFSGGDMTDEKTPEPVYALIEATDATKFVDEVNGAMAAGWKLHGSIVVTRTSEVTYSYLQAMIKE